MREVVPTVTIVMTFAVPVVAIICYFCHAAWKAWLDVRLKRDMVARGYTAKEIIDVMSLSQGAEGQSALADVPPAKPVRQPVYNS